MKTHFLPARLTARRVALSGMMAMMLALSGCQSPASTEAETESAPLAEQSPQSADKVHLLADGARYVGDREAGRMHGQGTFDNGAGLSYSGGWQHGKRHGEGTETRPDGSNYRGQWIDGKRSGSGRETWPDGTYHDGEWELNQPRGPGLRREISGIEINGVFAGNVVTSGMIVFPSGEFYAGPMFKPDGAMHRKMRSWLTDAAERMDPWSQLYLARQLLAENKSANTDPRVIELLTAAEAAGIAEASYLLGRALIDNNPDAAKVFLTRAADKGSRQALTALDDLALQTCTAPEACKETINAALSAAADAGDRQARRTLTRRHLEAGDAASALVLIRNFAISFADWQDLELLARAEMMLGQPDSALIHMQLALAQTFTHETTATETDVTRMKTFVDEAGDAVTPDETPMETRE